MSEQVADAIRRAIGDHGPITFAEYMELALYGPGGYYERPPVGPTGDFVTSPHVHPVFGALLGGAVRELCEALGGPVPLHIAEVGAGDGTLAAQMLGALDDLRCGLRGDRRQSRRSFGARRDRRASARAADLKGAPHVVVANELLDNLPFRRVRGDREIRIGLEGERFVEIETPWDGEPVLEDGEMLVPVGAFAFIDRLARTLERGYALLIDYGAVGSPGGDIHGYRDHRVVEDVLIDPGSSDITAGVGLRVDRPARRGARPGRLPFDHPARRSASRSGSRSGSVRSSGARLLLLDERDGLEAVRTWSGRSRATLLIDPSALGRLRWLLLASPGLPSPSWLP